MSAACRDRFPLLPAALLFVIGASLLGVAGTGCASGAPREARAPADTTTLPLRDRVESARHADLRWPAFPEFESEIERLYERAAWRALWLSHSRPTKAATRLIERLAGADSMGLDPADYDAAWLDSMSRGLLDPGAKPEPEALARFDLGLSVAAVRFVSALHRGRVSPKQMHAELFIPRASLAVEMAVDSLRDEAKQGAILDRLQPRLHHYRLLKNGLARYRALARDPGLVPLPALPRVVKPGMALRAAPRLRRLLEATEDLARPTTPRAGPDSVYSADLVAGVKQFQIRQGLEPDGVIGGATAERLNRPFAQRVRQIELGLERFRWLPVSFPQPPIIVNIPAFRLYAFRGLTDREDQVLAMDVVVGDAFDTNTPLFAADMKYLIFRPYWEVPASIMRAELGPSARRDPDYLASQRMVLVSGESASAPELPATRANIARIGKGVRVRQLPGPENSLGLVKFVFPNAHNVYLHDTAAKSLFAETRRDFSHGCIRVSDPVALAAHVLRDQPAWTIERIREAMNGKDDTRVNLSGPVPVCIVYTTALAQENGDVRFYPDIYRLDAELDRVLSLGYPYPK